jgi:hypothetical protein
MIQAHIDNIDEEWMDGWMDGWTVVLRKVRTLILTRKGGTLIRKGADVCIKTRKDEEGSGKERSGDLHLPKTNDAEEENTDSLANHELTTATAMMMTTR